MTSNFSNLPYDIKKYGIIPLLDSISKISLRHALIGCFENLPLDISEITREEILQYSIDFINYFRKLYLPDNLLISAFWIKYHPEYATKEKNIGTAVFDITPHYKELNIPECDFTTMYSAITAKYGCFNLFEWLIYNGGKFDIKACYNAARFGHLNILQRCSTYGINLNAEICAYAALGGHLEILQWLKDRNAPWNGSTCNNAILGGHLHILRWAIQNKCYYGKKAIKYAQIVKSRKLESGVKSTGKLCSEFKLCKIYKDWSIWYRIIIFVVNMLYIVYY